MSIHKIHLRQILTGGLIHVLEQFVQLENHCLSRRKFRLLLPIKIAVKNLFRRNIYNVNILCCFHPGSNKPL